MGRVLHSKTVAVEIFKQVTLQMKKKLVTKIIVSTADQMMDCLLENGYSQYRSTPTSGPPPQSKRKSPCSRVISL